MKVLSRLQATFLQKVVEDDYPAAYADESNIGSAWALKQGYIYIVDGMGGSVITKYRLTDKGREALQRYHDNLGRVSESSA